MAGNIKSGVKIFNVTGGYNPLSSASIKYTDLLTSDYTLVDKVVYINSSLVVGERTATYNIPVSGSIIALAISVYSRTYGWSSYGYWATVGSVATRSCILQISSNTLVEPVAQTVNGLSISSIDTLGTPYTVSAYSSSSYGDVRFTYNFSFSGNTLNITITPYKQSNWGYYHDFDKFVYSSFIQRLRVIHVG